MIAQNSEVYNPPTYLFSLYTYIWKKISVGGLYTSLFCAIIPALFPYFCRSGIPTSCYIFKCFLWVIPNQFSKSLQVTSSELDETWFVSTTCGYMKPDKILLSYVVWLPDYSPSKIQLFLNFAAVATIQILITFPYLIVL